MNTIEYYGGGAGIDNTPALNLANSAHEHDLIIGRGAYLFNSKPDPIGFDMNIIGKGVSTTSFVRNFVPATQDDYVLLFDGHEGIFGGGVSGIQFDAAAGDGGVAIYLSGTDQTHRAALMNFRDLWISSNHGKLWNRCLVANGLAIPDTPSNGGVRDLRFDNCYFFGAQANVVELWNAKNTWMVGGGAYNASSGGGIAVVGQSPNCRSEKVHINMSCGGQLNFSNANDVHFYGASAASMYRDATVDTLIISGNVGVLYGSAAVREKILK